MPTEILSGIWIGDINDSFNKEFISDNFINIFINCTLDYGYPNINEIKKLRIPLNQNLDPNRDIQLLYEIKMCNTILDCINYASCYETKNFKS